MFKSIILVGNGGDAGAVNVRYRKINGKFEVKTCAGVGSLPARNGVGGRGNMLYVYLKDNIKQNDSICS